MGSEHRLSRFLVLSCILSIALNASVNGQEKKKGGGDSKKGASTRSSKDTGSVKPYDEIITKEAKSQVGLFRVHRIKEKLFYEIEPKQLDRDMLWVTQLEETQAGHSYGGMPVGDRVVRWELRGEKVLLRDIKYSIRADVKGSIQESVAHTNVQSIIKVFDVKAFGKDKAPVIDVTSLFTGDVKEFSAAKAVGGSGIDSSRTFLETTKTFPTNLETKVLVTYRAGKSSTPTFGRRSSGPGRDSSQSGVTVKVHHSMVELPEQPMKPRVYDPRVGFFTVSFWDFANDRQHQVEETRFVTRWRLEKKDPNAAVSEPKKPIVFYVGRGVPEKWKPYVKTGIEMWQGAFEKAGFKNAIIGKLAPSESEDPDWDAEDARISTIRWLPSTTENAFGPHVHDPRTGEILEADVRIYHNVLKLSRDWYFVQASPNDERAQKLPLPDELVGELLAYVVAHEVGHSIGYPHNMKASSAYTVDNLRSPEFTKKHGTEASIMDYGRFNYVAQPGDGAALIPKVGPYDFFAIEWGYREYKTDEDEKKGSAELYAKQLKNRMLLFGNADPSEDPTRQTEDLGSDSVEATRLGMANLDRVAGYLVEACCNQGENYDLLSNMYDQVWSQRNRELMHVTSVVGGFEQKNFYFGDAAIVYHPIPVERQRAAVALLAKHAFETPTKLVASDIVLRLSTGGTRERVLSSQRSVLSSLIRESRIDRMFEHATRAAESKQPAYSGNALLEDIRKAIWKELELQPITIDLYRRNLQRAHINRLISAVASNSSDSELPGLARQQLLKIRRRSQDILKASWAEPEKKEKAARLDPVVSAHLVQINAQITKSLHPGNSSSE